jgi:4-hydroxythreonine-4-phosphate dehydrogenase
MIADIKVRPTIAMILGDPAGIGPELAAKLLALPETRDAARILIVGDRDELERGRRIAGVEFPLTTVESFEMADFSRGVPVLMQFRGSHQGEFALGAVSAAGGKYSLDALEIALELTRKGKTDATCLPPMSKASLHAGGMSESDALHWYATKIGFDGPIRQFNVLGDLWTARVTSHVALRDVSSLLTPEKIADAITQIHDVLQDAGVAAPRIAVCGLNPHNGDDGAFGREEIDIIAPGIALAAKRGKRASGPFPGDTIFIKARAGEYDGVVTMFHDQGQIAMKLMGFDHGVTVYGGLPIPVTTTAHGSAYDIEGQGKANVGSLREAFLLACRMAAWRRQAV